MPAGLQALGTRGKGQRCHLPRGLQALDLRDRTGLGPVRSRRPGRIGSALVRLYRCWATASPETPTFTADPRVDERLRTTLDGRWAASTWQSLFMANQGRTWQAPPGWPKPPDGWSPPLGWQPDPSWPPPPERWTWWKQTRTRWQWPEITLAVLGFLLLAASAVLFVAIPTTSVGGRSVGCWPPFTLFAPSDPGDEGLAVDIACTEAMWSRLGASGLAGLIGVPVLVGGAVIHGLRRDGRFKNARPVRQGDAKGR